MQPLTAAFSEEVLQIVNILLYKITHQCKKREDLLRCWCAQRLTDFFGVYRAYS